MAETLNLTNTNPVNSMTNGTNIPPVKSTS